MKTINVNIFSKQSINMAIRRIEEYRKEVETKTVVLAQRLAETGAEIVRIKIVEMGANQTGDMLSGVGGYFSPTLNIGVIKVTSDHAVFVEFGTGPVGASNPHPKPTGTYKGEGWWTQADGKDMAALYGWQPTVLENGDIIYYTEGQPAKPFMYETALELGIRFEQMAREVFA